jgi:hypothetical protein
LRAPALSSGNAIASSSPHPAASQPTSPFGRRFASTLGLLFSWLAFPALADEVVDLELVLAIDASSSVDDTEWELQRQGYAAAFRDPDIQAAVISGPKKRVAIAVVVWADASVPRWDSDWFVVADPAGSETLASFMAALPRIPMGGTGIGPGLAAAIRKLDRNGMTAPRQVVDVSGDGRETPPRETVVLIPMANAMAKARGVAVNGLAIINEDPGLAVWYRDNVIAGPGSFVITARNYDDFSDAIRRKLLREIVHQERMSWHIPGYN